MTLAKTSSRSAYTRIVLSYSDWNDFRVNSFPDKDHTAALGTSVSVHVLEMSASTA